MSDVISTRMDKKEIEELTKISEQERMDRSTLIRKFLLTQMKEYRMRDASEKYRKGLASLAEAATLAHVSLYEMMDHIQREKIQAPSLSESEMEEELLSTHELLKKRGEMR